MSKILRTRHCSHVLSHHKKSLARIRFSKKTKQKKKKQKKQKKKSTHSICLVCVVAAHRTPDKTTTMSIVQQSNVCSSSLIIQTHKTMTSPTESL